MHPPLAHAQEFWNYGHAYEKTAVGGIRRPEIFTPEILYNICGMALENFFMGWLADNGSLPENHTLRDLVRAAERHTTVPAELKQRLVRMDQFQDLCSLGIFTRKIPTSEDAAGFLKLVEETRGWLLSYPMQCIEDYTLQKTDK